MRTTRVLLDEPLVVGEPRPIIPSFCSQMSPTALGQDAEDANYAARADTPGSVARQLAARRIPADRFPDGVPAQGESPSLRTRSNMDT